VFPPLAASERDVPVRLPQARAGQERQRDPQVRSPRREAGKRDRPALQTRALRAVVARIGQVTEALTPLSVAQAASLWLSHRRDACAPERGPEGGGGTLTSAARPSARTAQRRRPAPSSTASASPPSRPAPAGGTAG